ASGGASGGPGAPVELIFYGRWTGARLDYILAAVWTGMFSPGWGMDFHKAASCRSIRNIIWRNQQFDELQSYCRKMNYQETFVQKWLMLFDADQKTAASPTTNTANALGLPPKKDVIAKHKSQQSKGKKSGKTARAVKVAKRRKEQEETRVTVETVKPPVQEEVVQPPPKAAAAGQAPQPPPSQAPSRRSRIRNEQLSYSGVMLHSRARVLAKKVGGQQAGQEAERERPAPPLSSDRPWLRSHRGDKNGGIRQSAHRAYLEAAPSSSSQDLRAAATSPQSLHPAGSVLILLAGRHAASGCVFLKQLASGLLLVTGAIQGQRLPAETRLPELRDRHQDSAGAGDLRLPERLNDAYFRRSQSKQKASSAAQGPVHPARRPPTSSPRSVARTRSRSNSQVMSALVKLGRPDKKLMLAYLSSLFSLKSGQRPHDMVF
uniref:SANT domain-containing protein n=1 Tax=Macrostomum lignano TaxID=282301 RepID=A0A1I8FP09_9PLAT